MLVLLIRSLDVGGAERQFVSLAKGLHDRGVQLNTLTFYSGGAFRSELEQSGVSVVDLDKQGRWDFFGFLLRLFKKIRYANPTTIYGFLPVANILSAILGALFNAKVVWGVRASNMDLDQYDWLSRIVSVIEKLCASRADLIICNSTAGLEYHATRGFPRDKMVVIHNGIDTEHFRRKEDTRRQVRAGLGLRDSDVLIGIAARIDPMKGYPTFLRAASLVATVNKNVRFICVGDGDLAYRGVLEELVAALGLSRHLTWTGRRTDMPTIYSAFDVAVSSSSGEGFSNSIAEAMSCECPCVVTDVGDSAYIVGDTGWVVPPEDSSSLAEALIEVAKLSQAERSMQGSRARDRIVKNFNLQYMIDRTSAFL